jgi:hypothetical protein
VGVFLRWGIFGIIAVAALIYAYNALGHLADRRKAAPATVLAPPERISKDAESVPTPAPQTSQADQTPERCRVELTIAQRATEARSIGEPLDRLLRIQEIAWQEDAKLRERLTQLATRWYNEPGPIDAGRLRRDVVTGCVEFKK